MRWQDLDGDGMGLLPESSIEGSAMSAAVGSHEDRDALQLARPGAKSFFVWIGLALLGFPLGGLLGHVVGGRVDSVMPSLIGGALTGAGIGLAQWFMLRRNPGVGLEWVVATSAGLAAGLTLGAMAVGYETTISQLATMGAISGAFVGVAQGLLLRGKFPLWHVWMLAMPPLWALGWVVTTAGGIAVEKQFTVFGAYGAITFGALSALLLIAGMRSGMSVHGRADRTG